MKLLFKNNMSEVDKLGILTSVIVTTFFVGLTFALIQQPQPTMIVDTGSDIMNFGNAESIVWQETAREDFYFEDNKTFWMENAYQLDADTWICVGDCQHPLNQVPFVNLCNEMEGRAYFNPDGDGLICDLK